MKDPGDYSFVDPPHEFLLHDQKGQEESQKN